MRSSGWDYLLSRLRGGRPETQCSCSILSQRPTSAGAGPCFIPQSSDASFQYFPWCRKRILALSSTFRRLWCPITAKRIARQVALGSRVPLGHAGIHCSQCHVRLMTFDTRTCETRYVTLLPALPGHGPLSRRRDGLAIAATRQAAFMKNGVPTLWQC